MLGTLDGRGDSNDPDPVNQESAKLQAVVSFAGPSDLLQHRSAAAASFLGTRPPRSRDTTSEEYRTYRDASPATHASRDDAPFLLIHGDADASVAFEQARLMQQAMSGAGVDTRLVRVPGGGHGVSDVLLREGSLPTEGGRFEVAEVVGWFDTHLRKH